MRYGASAFLGLVEAELADYGDCARYQIACPCCREAVFKGVRTHGGGRGTHYFSHYREVPEEQAERCELRVSSITAAQAEKAKADARGQALAVFVARFRECVLRSPWRMCFGHDPLRDIERDAARMLARPKWREVARACRVMAREEWQVDPEDLPSYARELHEVTGLLFRKEIAFHAKAMLNYALAPGSAQAWLFLASFAALVGLESSGLPRAELAAVLDGSNKELARALDKLGDRPGEDGHSALGIMLLDIVSAAVTILSVIPYEDILREAIGDARRLHGRPGAFRVC